LRQICVFACSIYITKSIDQRFRMTDIYEALSVDESVGLYIWTGTWNLQSSSVADELDPWLSGPKPDIVAVSLQELVELSAKNILKKDAPTGKIQCFTQLFEAAMSRVWMRSYKLIQMVSMVGQFIAVYVRPQLIHKISKLDADRVKSGVEGIFGNKGAVCVRFLVQGHGDVCFCNVHLASGVTHTEERKAHLRQLFLEAFQDLSQRDHVRKPKKGYRRAGIYKVHKHHAVFLMGDFNFRLIPGDGDMLKRDQFRNKVSTDAWLHNHFTESPITFPPTYKYIVGTRLFDEKREPAWCDRVLYGNSEKILPLEYNSVSSTIHTSDHRPVHASFLWFKEDYRDNRLKSKRLNFDVPRVSGRKFKGRAVHGIVDSNLQPVHGIVDSNHQPVPGIFDGTPTRPSRESRKKSDMSKRDSGSEFQRQYHALFGNAVQEKPSPVYRKKTVKSSKSSTSVAVPHVENTTITEVEEFRMDSSELHTDSKRKRHSNKRAIAPSPAVSEDEDESIIDSPESRSSLPITHRNHSHPPLRRRDDERRRDDDEQSWIRKTRSVSVSRSGDDSPGSAPVGTSRWSVETPELSSRGSSRFDDVDTDISSLREI